ncbi:hypothetical protein [Brevibacillus humidisoli]|uniref:hypothetical protein n=1 Tax=Brevibacillus humidisoli TaxID=2895522 RepID=UPI0030B9AD73
MILHGAKPERAGEPIYFMTDDDPTDNSIQYGVLRIHYEPVVQPNHIETVMAQLNMNGREEIWKYSIYFDNPQFWSDPGVKNEDMHQRSGELENRYADKRVVDESICYKTIKREPVPNQYELYNLTEDPLEINNLAYPEHATERSREIQAWLAELLEQQCRQKRLAPTSGTVPGMPTCNEIEG